MNSEKLVVNQPLDQLKQSPSRQHRAKQYPAIPCQTDVPRRTKQHHQSDHRHQPESQMEKAILRNLNLKLLDGGRLAMRRYTDQMMPAKNLVEDDSVCKTAEPHAKNNARTN